MSDPFYKQDIFFLITSIAVAVLTILLAVLAVYLIKVFKDIKYITKKAKSEADLITEDIHELRQNVRQEGAKVAHLAKFLTKLKNKKK
jgi:uncharacterized protein YoxC